ncbi:MAG: type II secretion system protein, partial [Thermogutta sp.]
MYLSQAIVNLRTCQELRRHDHLLVGVAFTLIETIIALGLMAVVVGAVTYSLVSSLQVAEENQELAIAEGLAQDLMNEILNRRYCELGTSP